MFATRLKLTNLRAIETAEFRFKSGVNLIVGVNGVGKTSVLDALGVCLSAIVKQANQLRHRAVSFSADDIRIGADALTVESDVRIGGRDYSYLVHKPRESSTPRYKKVGKLREQVHETPGKAMFMGEPPAPVSGRESGGRPVAVLFSTNRAVPTERSPAKAVTAGGVAGAFGDAFAKRELRLGEFAAWMKAQKTLLDESPRGARELAACEESVRRFLPGYRNLRLKGEKRPQLQIDRNSTTIPVRHLSDGERGNLALVLDLTRRLAQANPEMEDPSSEAEAVVLIDEVDLHLHPTWQRQIVHNLTTAFPRCQFIVTTHSPQVIGEVPHECIHIIADGQVYPPTHSYGVDSSRVLEEIMEAKPRTEKVDTVLTEISRVIGNQQFARGRELLKVLGGHLGEEDPEVTRLRTLLDFLEGRE